MGRGVEKGGVVTGKEEEERGGWRKWKVICVGLPTSLDV